MKKFYVIFCFLFLVLSLSGCASSSGIIGKADVTVNMTPRQISATNEDTFEDVISTVTPAIVGISAIYGNSESVGSGVALAPNGYVLTNQHVVGGASDITVYYANKTSGSAELVWSDLSMDLAVIKATIDMPYLEIGDSSVVTAGEDVIAVGTPLTLQFKHTVTKGIVSAIDRTIEVDNSDGSTSYLQNLIQHDASINPGNSGGPLINNEGQVIGINTLKVSEAEGIGFAIPIEVAIPVLNKISQTGTYTTPYLGIFGFDSVIAVFYGKTFETDGVYLVKVDENGSCAKAGLVSGDVIIGVDGVGVKTMLDLRKIIYNYDVGDKVSINYISNGEKKQAELTLTKK